MRERSLKCFVDLLQGKGLNVKVVAEVCRRPSQTSMIESFVTIVNGYLAVNYRCKALYLGCLQRSYDKLKIEFVKVSMVHEVLWKINLIIVNLELR